MLKVKTIYFSATGTTEKIVKELAHCLNEKYNSQITSINFTLPEAREEPSVFDKNDIVIVGVPVYAGRVPNVLLKYMNALQGNGALAVAVVVYGNRNYDDALIELTDILEKDGFKVIAAGAFIGEHSFSYTLGKDRPDGSDLKVVHNFADEIYSKTCSGKFAAISVKGSTPYHSYYVPKNESGASVDLRKVTPKTKISCNNCKICAAVCPMGSIDSNDVTRLTGICIKCGACIKRCPIRAKYFDDVNYLWHKEELESKFSTRREAEIFI
jgi:NAD-dependent dihydropyrimidine dehydrogenase PreA subunit/protein involved in ribonucleotide reduction